MVATSAIRLDRTFAALADPTRRAILARLAGGEATAGELARPFPISAPAISRHLRSVGAGGTDRAAPRRPAPRFRLEPKALRTAAEWLDFYRKFWSESLDQLAEHLKTKPSRSRLPGGT